MSDLNSDIKKAIELIDNRRIRTNYNTMFDNIYSFTNENTKEALKEINLNNKKCLTVLGSSDQALEMCQKGASAITTFDINPLTKYYLNLKVAALKANLSLDEYLEYFCYTDMRNIVNYKAFNNKTFLKIKEYLDGDSYIFWNKLYKKYSDNPHMIRYKDGLFKEDENIYSILKTTINYLNDDNYEKLKHNIENTNINFINSNIKEICNELNEKYDFIYLSNIIQYTSRIFKNNITNTKQKTIYELEQYKNLIEKLSNYLNKNGILYAGYIYLPERTGDSTAIYDVNNKKKIFSEDEYEFIRFTGMYQLKNKKYNSQDECIVYTKR